MVKRDDEIEAEIEHVLGKLEHGGRCPTTDGVLSPRAAVRLATRSYEPVVVRRQGSWPATYSALDAAAQAEDAGALIFAEAPTTKRMGKVELGEGGVVLVPKRRPGRDAQKTRKNMT